jgi:hypothetical protein
MKPMNLPLPKTSHITSHDPYAADRDMPPGRPENTGDYKKALACFGTGVTVITAHHDWQDVGMTCNSFSSVSLNPAMVLWSIRKAASSLIAFTESNGFMVNVLAHDQQALACNLPPAACPTASWVYLRNGTTAIACAWQAQWHGLTATCTNWWTQAII